MQQFFTISEAAKYLDITRQAIEDRIKRGTLASTIRTMKLKKQMIPLSELVKAKSKNALAFGK